MTKTNWAPAVVSAVVVLLVFGLGVALLFGLSGRGSGGWGMMGPGMMGFGPFGWLGMMFMGLFPLGLLVLFVLGIVWLVRWLGGQETRSRPAALACPRCHRSIQADWQVCPHCGHRLAGGGQEE